MELVFDQEELIDFTKFCFREKDNYGSVEKALTIWVADNKAKAIKLKDEAASFRQMQEAMKDIKQKMPSASAAFKEPIIQPKTNDAKAEDYKNPKAFFTSIFEKIKPMAADDKPKVSADNVAERLSKFFDVLNHCDCPACKEEREKQKTKLSDSEIWIEMNEVLNDHAKSILARYKEKGYAFENVKVTVEGNLKSKP